MERLHPGITEALAPERFYPDLRPDKTDGQGVLTLRSASMINAKTTNPRNRTSSLSKRENTRQKPLVHRNRCSTSLRRRYRVRSYFQEDAVALGGYHGLEIEMGRQGSGLLVFVSTRAWGESEGDGSAGLPGHPRKWGVPAAPGLADALGTVFRAPVGMNLDMGTVGPHDLGPDPNPLLPLKRLEPAVPNPALQPPVLPQVDSAPVTESLRQIRHAGMAPLPGSSGTMRS